MAMLKDSIITGDLRVTGTIYGKATNAVLADEATAVRDKGNGTLTYLNYGAAEMSTTSWIGSWDGYTLKAISPANLKTTMALNNVENTKLSTWAGSSNITTIGTLSSGTVPWARLSNVPTASTSAAGIIQIGTGSGNAAAGNHTHDDRYYTETEVNSKLSGKANASHTHDDRYYTESETDTKLETKASLVSHTTIPKGADLNSATYQAVGSYGQPLSSRGSSISNTPVSDAFMLNVYNPLSSDTGNSGNWIYRLQEVIHYSTGRKWYRFNYTNGSGTWSYGAWRQVAFTGESQPASDVYSWAKASSKPSYSKSEVGLGNVANIDQSKAIKSITRSGTTFTATALDGTTSTFTQQDNNTTYPLNGKTINGSYKTAYRTQTKGDTNSGWYVSSIRNDTSSVDSSPQYGSGLAWGNGDTHGYLYTSYSADAVYVGGGNADKLNWVSRVYTTNYKPSVAAHSYTPAGTISVQTAGSTVAADDITAWTTNTPTAVTKKTVVTSATVSNEILTISTGDSVTVTAGTAASLSYTARTVKSGDAAYKFSGTAASLTHTVS